ncbi:FG-GAP-like repeat-containing protein [Tautonia plasticadhaerens]|uniref:FG-GAP-like repeat-containing protein n=1 Tax=Tautonia plasticadhaerens TaxID=2527974 RepID=UPI00119F8FEC|nr:FG-GAP-like repeat-containing protein [Tautonia plasticadhaerens]
MESLEPRVVLDAGVTAAEAYVFALINEFRADPARFASTIEAYIDGEQRGGHGFDADDPILAEVRSSVDYFDGRPIEKGTWHFSDAMAFLRSQGGEDGPTLGPYGIDEYLAQGADDHVDYMDEVCYAHSWDTQQRGEAPVCIRDGGKAIPGGNYDYNNVNYPDRLGGEQSSPGENIGGTRKTEGGPSSGREIYEGSAGDFEAFAQRQAYLGTLSYIVDWGNPDMGHAKNLLGRDGPAGASTSGLGLSGVGKGKGIYASNSIGVGFGFYEDRTYYSTHRIANRVEDGGYVVGMAYQDFDQDARYDIGEGLGDLTLGYREVGTRAVTRAPAAPGNEHGIVQAWLPNGTYEVGLVGNSGQLIKPQRVVIADANKAVDFRLPPSFPLTGDGGLGDPPPGPDAFEPNDDREAARWLGAASYGSPLRRAEMLTIDASDDVDYFYYQIDGRGGPDDKIAIYFDHEAGNLDAYLFARRFDGSYVLADKSESTDDDELLDLTGDEGNPVGFTVGYMLAVVGAGGDTNIYTLDAQIRLDRPLPDQYEPNNNFFVDGPLDLGIASAGSPLFGTLDLNFHDPDDEDLFTFRLNGEAGDDSFIHLGTDNDGGAGEPILVELYRQAPDGSFEFVRDDYSVDLEKFISLDGLDFGTYGLSLRGFSTFRSDPNTYTMEFNVEPGPLAADPLEPNDEEGGATDWGTISVASPLEVDRRDLSIDRGGDEDWYALSLADPAGEGDRIKASFEHDSGDLDLILYRREKDGSLVEVDRSAGEENVEEIGLDGLAAGSYLVRVLGYDGDTNFYQLEADIRPVDRTPPSVVGISAGGRASDRDPIDVAMVTFSEPIDPASFGVDDLRLTRDGQPVDLDGVAVDWVDETTYRVVGLGALTRRSAGYELVVDAGGLRDLSGNPGVGRLAEPIAFRRVVEGDYDNDGVSDLALYRYDATAGAAVFELRLSNQGSPETSTVVIDDLGPNVIPIAGDFDGDGQADVAVVDPQARLSGSGEPNASIWTYLRSSDGERVDIPFGAAGVLDRPAPADYDGDGATDIATFRADSDLVPGAAQWFILPSASGSAFSVVFGAAGGTDLPAPFDFDGDGRADIATFRPISDLVPGAAQWFILPSARNDATFSRALGAFPITFGAAGNADQPAVADFDGDGRAEIVAFRSESDLEPGRAQWFVLPSRGEVPGFGDGFPVTFGSSGDIAAVADYDGDGRPDYAVFDQGSGAWTIGSANADGRPGPGRAEPFDPTGGAGIPVLSPLYFRLRVTDNIPAQSSASASLASVAAARSAARRSGDGDDDGEGSRIDLIDDVLEILSARAPEV